MLTIIATGLNLGYPVLGIILSTNIDNFKEDCLRSTTVVDSQNSEYAMIASINDCDLYQKIKSKCPTPFIFTALLLAKRQISRPSKQFTFSRPFDFVFPRLL